MDQRAIIDVVCKAALNNLSGEISALLGHDLVCSDIKLETATKEQLFSNPERPKTALTNMTVSGDREGSSYLLCPISTAAILGGTLIMLPEDMIEENASKGVLDGELNDAYGEVANIIAGVFTQAFVDKYAKTLRFIKKVVEPLTPTKVDPDSDAPFPPGNYYVASCHMALADQDLGVLELIVPNAIFDLEEAAPEVPAKEVAPTPSVSSEPTPQEQSDQATPEPVPEAPQEPEAKAQHKAKKLSFADQKKLVDVVFKATISQVGEEVGALLGQPLTCDDIQLQLISKADFFSSHCLEKSVLSHMKVTGDQEGLGFLIAQVPDTIIMGGTLIMLPDDQIEERRKKGIFDGEVADAYGEIANIISGSLTQTFLDRYPQQIRFIRTESEVITPTKMDLDSDQPFPEGTYYLASCAMHMDEYELNRLFLIFPAEVFTLEDVLPEKTAGAAQAEEMPAPGEWGGPPAEQTAASGGPAPGEWGGPPAEEGPAPGEWGGAPVSDQESTPAAQSQEKKTQQQPGTGATADKTTTGSVVLIISDQPDNAATFVDILSAAGYQCQVLSFQDEIREKFQQFQIQGIFLIMTQVGEKGFAAAIKLQSAGRPLPPLIFAGPEWTRSAVLRAVKYGAKDILMTPASGEEIQQKITQHLKKAS